MSGTLTEKEQTFYKMCMDHDLTYEYSDDGSVWRRGGAQLAKLISYAKEHLEPEKAVEIWNSVVKEKVAREDRKQFYWDKFPQG